MKKLFYLIIPYLELKNAEVLITKKIEEIFENSNAILEPKNIEETKITLLKEFYDDTINVKKTIEDKAKTGILGITITIGLIASIITNYNKLSIFSIIIFLIALFYSLYGGYIALKVLSDKNTIYQLGINDLKLKGNDLKEALAINSLLNIKMNIIRQNYVYTSFKHLVYSIVLMVCALLVNIVLHQKEQNMSSKINIDCNVSIFNHEKELKDKILFLSKEIRTNKQNIEILQQMTKNKHIDKSISK